MSKYKLDKKFIEAMAKGLYNIAMREGPLEDFHAQKTPIGDKEMETINKHAFNSLAYLMTLWFGGLENTFIEMCVAGALPLGYFDPPDFNSNAVKKLEALYKEITAGN